MPLVYDFGFNDSMYGVDISKLTFQQRVFVGYWTLHRNLTWAAKQAGYKHPNVAGTKTSQVGKVKEVMLKLDKVLKEKSLLVLAEVAQKVALAVHRDYNDLRDILPIVEKIPPQCFPYIDGIEVEPIYDNVRREDEEGNVYYQKELIDQKIKLKLMPNKDAMDMAIKLLGGYAPEKHEQAVSIDWSKLEGPPTVVDDIESEIESLYLEES